MRSGTPNKGKAYTPSPTTPREAQRNISLDWSRAGMLRKPVIQAKNLAPKETELDPFKYSHNPFIGDPVSPSPW